MSVVTYNGITLPYPLHSSFSMERVYDESGTDPIYLKLDITVQCVIGPDYFTTITNQLLASDSIVSGMKWIRHQLLIPRKQLSVTVGGNDLVPPRQDKDVGNQQRTVDAKNGPQPQRCDITALTPDTFLMTYHIIAHYWENYEAVAHGNIAEVNKAGNPVVSLRWSESQEVDQRNFTRRIRQGTFIIRSDMVERKQIDNFREDFAVLAIPPGFVRKSASYTVDPTGLKMSFRLEDQEVYLLPPFPAYEASGTYTETLSRQGAKRFCQCTVELKGRKSADATESKTKLIEVAIGIALKKIVGAAGPTIATTTHITRSQASAVAGSILRGYAALITLGASTAVLGDPVVRRKETTTETHKPAVVMEQMIVSTDLYDNTVRVTAMFWVSSAAVQLGGTRYQKVDIMALSEPPLGSEVGVGESPAVSVFGNPDVDSFLKAAAYFDPSLQQKLNNSIGQTFPTDPHGIPGEGNG